MSTAKNDQTLTADERAIRDAPPGAERYYIFEDGVVRYMKKTVHRHISAWHSNQQEDPKWRAGADFYDKSKPLPIEYSAENPPPEGWEGFAQLPVGDRSSEVFVFIKNGKVYEKNDHWDITDANCFTPIPARTKRDEFIDLASKSGADFGKLYDKFIGGDS